MSDNFNNPYRSCPRSYVRRGRITASQKHALEVHGDRVLLSTDSELSVVQAFTYKPQHLCLEIGFGTGENLLAMATKHSDVDFLGIEVYTPGTGRVIREIHKQGLTNIRIYHHDVVDLLYRCIPDGSINSCFILCPDPWPKTKHHKRRLIQHAFVDILWQVMTHKATLWITTDWQHYADKITELFCNDTRWNRISVEDTFLRRTLTKFERKGAIYKRSTTDLIWQKI